LALDDVTEDAEAVSHALVCGGISELLVEARAVADVDKEDDAGAKGARHLARGVGCLITVAALGVSAS
jgi:hypothetical protein